MGHNMDLEAGESDSNINNSKEIKNFVIVKNRKRSSAKLLHRNFKVARRSQNKFTLNFHFQPDSESVNRFQIFNSTQVGMSSSNANALKVNLLKSPL